MMFRMYYKERGGHTGVRVYAGTHEGALGKCGDLVFRNEEWAEFMALPQAPGIEFINEDERGKGKAK